MIKWIKRRFRREGPLSKHFRKNPLPENFDIKKGGPEIDQINADSIDVVPTYYNADGTINENFKASK